MGIWEVNSFLRFAAVDCEDFNRCSIVFTHATNDDMPANLFLYFKHCHGVFNFLMGVSQEVLVLQVP